MRLICVIVSFIGAIFVVAAFADDDAAKYPFLAELNIPKDRLPKGCEIVDLPADAAPGLGLKNYSVTTDARAFLIGDEKFKELIDPNDVEAIYLALYKEKNDLGIFGWTFKSDDAAKATATKMKKRYAKQSEQIRVWQVKKNVVFLWCDPGTTNGCFIQLAQFIQATVDAANKPATSPAATTRAS